MNVENAQAQMRKGVLEFCVLAIISEGEIYPSDIIGRLKDSRLLVAEGTVYPLLNRLKNMELLSYQWVESNSSAQKVLPAHRQGQAVPHRTPQDLAGTGTCSCCQLETP